MINYWVTFENHVSAITCSILAIETPEQGKKWVQSFGHIFHTLFYCFYCCLGESKCRLGGPWFLPNLLAPFIRNLKHFDLET